jgi:predicted HicB family RNase H-like nuclease
MAEKPRSKAMKNVIEIDGHKAVLSVDPEIGMIRGEFLGLDCKPSKFCFRIL